MIEALQVAGGVGGIGGLLAVTILYFYRIDRKDSLKQMREDRRFMEDRLTKLLEDDQRSRETNTRALVELTILIQKLNGRL